MREVTPFPKKSQMSLITLIKQSRFNILRQIVNVSSQLLRISKISSAQLGLENLLIEGFYADKVGKTYGVDKKQKKELLKKILKINRSIPSATPWVTHLLFAKEILSIPASVKGDVIECGCYKGASTASLSLICEITQRKLIACDSFQGLPKDQHKEVHCYPYAGVYGYYKEGMYEGSFEEVKKNINQHGSISSCEFLPGFFSETLHQLKDPIVFAFLDVDLMSSTLDCIRAIWPLLQESCYIYSDDSADMEIVKIWFDEGFWKKEFDMIPPGYVGAGCGLPINMFFSSLGFVQKVNQIEKTYQKVPWLSYPEEGSINQTG